MWKLINCGTYIWFIKTKLKYHHCVYAITGEYKKLKIERRKPGLYSGGINKFYLAYLECWDLDKTPCRLDKKVAKFYINHWKKKEKTKRIKEILKQLKAI